MNFLESSTGGVLKILQYSQESCRPAALLKTDSSTGVYLEYC